jgi:hypothetical protein
MAEVGLLPFARVALQVATPVLPPHRTRFSKQQFTQPQLLAVLCLMRYADVPCLSGKALPATQQNRTRFLSGQTQAVFASPRT